MTEMHFGATTSGRILTMEVGDEQPSVCKKEAQFIMLTTLTFPRSNATQRHCL